MENINKNVAVWRGSNTPPTIYHLWIKEDNSQWLYKDTGWVNVNEEIQGDLQDIYEVLYTQHSQVSLSVSPTIIEKGIPTNITARWSTKFNNEEIASNSLTLKSGGTVLANSGTTYSESIDDSKKYDLTVTLQYGINKNVSSTVNAYYPMYFGSSADSTITDVIQFTKQPIKSSPNGNYSLSVQNNQYVWLCVPSNMNINKVTSRGFDVPMEDSITVTVPGKDKYKCYRSQNTFKAGVFNFTIV